MFSLESNLLTCSWQEARKPLEIALRGHKCQPFEQPYRIGSTYMLLRGEQYQDGSKELVVVALAGEMAQGTLAAVNHARVNGFDSIRAHFFTRGAERYIRRKLKLPVREIARYGQHERVLQIRFEDMGGRSKSRNDTKTVTNTTNVSGTASTAGDNYGVMLSGVNDSDINLAMTDHGAIAIAGDLAEEAFSLGSTALDSNVEVSTHAIDTITNMAGQQSATTKAAIAMANSAKAREQTGTSESDNSMLKTVSLIVGITGTIVTIAVVLVGRNS